jgi:AcrR family transcriptional regulator
MSQGNVYWYFSSKEDLLKAVLADGFEALGSLIEGAANRLGSLVQLHGLGEPHTAKADQDCDEFLYVVGFWGVAAAFSELIDNIHWLM